MICVFRTNRLLGLASLIAYLAVAMPSTSRAGDILPTNGSVAAGSATIGAPAKGALTVQQQSSRAVIDWGSFSIGSGNSVQFVQPDASSATLNRVTGSTTATIAGSLTSNGSVFLINPNGIQITPTGVVTVDRGFVASTLDISNDDFMAGKTSFLGTGALASVSNAGRITTGSGGFVALLGGMVDNAGLIAAPLGKIGLGSGEQATLDFSGDQFLQVAVPTNATDAAGTPLITNSGKIDARGGQVVLTAATARNAVRDAINIPGSIQASSVSGRNGAIVLGGGDGGNVAVSGKLRSAAGSIAVSGNRVALTKARVSTASKKAVGGSVSVTAATSIDLTGTMIDASGPTGGTVLIGGGPSGRGTLPHAQSVTMDATSTIQANGLGAGSGGQIVLWSDGVTQAYGLLMAQGGAVSGNGGTIETSGESVDFTGLRINTSAAAGTTGLWLTDPYDLTIGSADATTIASNLSTTNVTLKTTASGTTGPGTANAAGTGDITIGSAITWSSGNTLALDAYHGIAVTAPITVSGTGGVILTTNDGGTGGTLGFGLGSSGHSGSLSYTGSGGALTINGTSYTLVRSMADMAAINASASTLTGHYALANSIADASSTTNWVPIGTDGNNNLVLNSNGFSGAFEGLGQTISNLTINKSNNQFVGLFGYTYNATLENLGLTGGSVTGQNYVGGLVGFAASSGRIANVFSTEAVTGNYRTGGIVGEDQVAITGSYSTGTITGYSDWTGGLVGFSEGNGSIDQSYSTSTVNGANYVGGLVGANWGQFTTNSYATGAVTGGFRLGGLVGDNRSTLSNAYATGSVYSSGSDEIGGLVGHNYSAISNSHATGAVTGNSNVGGLLGVNEGSVNTAYASGQVTGRYNQIGGLVGGNYNTLATVDATGNVSGMNYVGGLAGYSRSAVSSAYATGTVTYSSTYGSGGDEFGGLVGQLDNGGSLTNSYYAGSSVTALTNAGGLVGYMIPGATLTNSHYDIDQVSLNSSALVTAGGLYDGQFQSWLPTKSLTVGSYFGSADSNGYYSLSTIQNLKNFLGFAEDPTLKWKFVNNIDLTSMSGQVVPYFAGTFDGGNFTVNNLSINQLNSNLGLFGFAKGATISNLMVSGSVQGLDYIGGVIGSMYNSSSTAIAASNAVSSVTVTSQQYGGTQTGSGNYTGGLAGFLLGSATNASASGAVIGGRTYTGGLIGFTQNGTITDGSATGTVTAYSDQTGGLIGQSNTAVVDSRSSGTVTETNGNWTGGLIGYSNNSITSSWSSSTVIAGNYAGGLVGCNCGGTIDQSYATGAISGGFRIGGLIGQNQSTLTNSYATGNVTATSDEIGGLIGHNYSSVSGSYTIGTVSGQNSVGGFVGYNDGTITTSSSPGNITATGSQIGGFAGYNNNSITTSHSTGNITATGNAIGGFAGGSNGALTTIYATGTVAARTTGSAQVAGLVGRMDSGATLTDSYSTGNVTGTSALGGLVGYLVPGAQVINSHYDEGTILINSGTLWSIGGITDGQYTAWTGNGRSLSLAAYGFTPDGNGVYSIASIQDLINFQGFAETAGLNWKLTTNLNLSANAGLFTPYFGGASFDGGSHTISHLALNQSSADLGLFGAIYNGSISDITVAGSVTAETFPGSATGDDYIGSLAGSFYTNNNSTIGTVTSSVTVYGNSQVGGLVGWSNGAISAATVSGDVTGLGSNIGGLGGYMQSGSITSVTASGTVTGYGSNSGGLVGDMQGGSITGSTASGSVTGYNDSTGGLVGYIGSGTVSQSSASGVVDGVNYTGGLVGLAQNDTIDTTFATGNVTGNSRVGGLVGQNQGTITNSHTTAATVTGNGDAVGGFVGWDYGTIGSAQYSSDTVSNINGSYTGGFVGVEQGNGFTNVWATGNVTGNNRVGGLIGYDDGRISNSYATGSVTGTGDGTGGFVGQHNSNQISNSYSSGTVTGANYTGGFAGLQYGQDSQNYATGNVIGAGQVGGYAGQNSGGTITGSYATGTVYGANDRVGGFVGYEYYGTLSGDFSTGAVTSFGNNVGGFAGRIEGGSATSDFATGATTGVNQVGGFAGFIVNTTGTANVYGMGLVTGSDQVGGLAGSVQNATLSNTFAIGNVIASTTNVGGLVGYVDSNTDTITNGLWNSQTTGQTVGVGPSGGIYTGSYTGVAGKTTSQLIDSLPSGFDTSAWATGTGLYPYLTAIFSTTPQSISGYAYTSAGTLAVDGQVSLYKSGTLLGYGTASVGADGSYYQLVAGGALTTTSKLGIALTPSGATSVSARIYSDQRTLTSGNDVARNITSGQDLLTTSAASLSALNADLATTFGTTTEAAIETSLTADPFSLMSTASGGFTINTALSQTGSMQIQTVGSLTFGTGGSLSSLASGDAVVLAANGAFVNNAGTNPISTANGRWLIYTQATGSSGSAATGNGLAGLNGLSYYGDVYNFSTGTFASAANSGNRFVYGYQPTLTVTATTQSLVYNGQQQSDSYGVGGLLNGDTQAQALAGTVTGLTTSSRHANAYVLTPGGLNSNDLNYLIDYVSGTLTISPAPLTIAATNQTATYGTAQALDTSATTGYTTSGLQTGDSISGLTESISVGGSFLTSTAARTGVGGYTITPSAVQGFTNSDYAITYATSGTFTVDPLAVILSGTKSYDATTTADSSDLSIANIVSGDSVTLGGTATMAGSHVVSAGVESLASLGGLTLSNSNYTVVGGSGSFTVTPAALTITARNQTATYGTAQALDTSATTGYTASGLQTGDSITGLTETIMVGGSPLTATAAHTAAGGYAITPSSVQGLTNSDYAITYAAGGTFTVNPLAVILGGSQMYNASTAVDIGNLVIANIVSGDRVTLGGTATMASSHVVAGGSQALTSLGGLTLSNSNYTVVGGSGSFTVTPAALTITAGNQTATYGTGQALDTSATTGYTASGLQTGDSITGLTEAIMVGGSPLTATTAHTAAGGYAITPSFVQGLTNSDYAITYATTGTLTINPRAIVLTGSKSYDASTTADSSDLSITNIVAGDNVTVGGTATMAGSHVVVGGVESLVSLGGLTLSNSNYTVVGGRGSFTVTPAALTITAGNQTATYGTGQALDTSATTGYTASGLQTGDSITGLTEAIMVGGSPLTATTAHTAAGGYAITPSFVQGLTNSDYAITYATTGTLTINPRAIVLTGSKSYDASTTADSNDLSITNIVAGDNVTVGGTATMAGSHVVVGGVESLVSLGGLTLSNSNYTVVDGRGSVTVTPAALTITAGNQTATYGTGQALDTSATTGYTASGLQTGDSITGLTEAIMVGGSPLTATTAHTAAGGYAITPSFVQGLTNSDYAITYATTGTFTVNPLAVILTGSQMYNASTAVDIGNLVIANLVSGDSVTIGGSTTMAGRHVVAGGSQALTSLGGLTLSNSNYTLVGGSGSLTVTAAPLTIAATNQTATYDTAQMLNTAATTGYTVSSLQSGDGITGLTETISIGGIPVSATTAMTATGTYAITPSAALGISMLDYAITYASTGKLTIIGTSTLPTKPTGPTTTLQQPLVYSVVMPIIGNPVTPYTFVFNNLLSTGTTKQGQDGTPATPGSSKTPTSCVAQDQNGTATGTGPSASVQCSSN